MSDTFLGRTYPPRTLPRALRAEQGNHEVQMFILLRFSNGFLRNIPDLRNSTIYAYSVNFEGSPLLGSPFLQHTRHGLVS